MRYSINCPGCGRTTQDEVPIPQMGNAVYVECSTCGYRLATFQETTLE